MVRVYICRESMVMVEKMTFIPEGHYIVYSRSEVREAFEMAKVLAERYGARAIWLVDEDVERETAKLVEERCEQVEIH